MWKTTEAWSVYQNDLLGYEFSFPPQATVSSFGPDSYSPDDVPPDIKLDYFALLESIYPDGLCVGIEYEMGFVIIKAPLHKGGKFVTCGVTGVGDYNIVDVSETVVIGGQSYSAQGYKVYSRDATATPRNEFFFVVLEDGTTINYGGKWANNGATYEGYVPVTTPQPLKRRGFYGLHRGSLVQEPICSKPRFHRDRSSIHRQGNRAHERTMSYPPPSHSKNTAAMYLWDQPIGQHDQPPPLCTCCTGSVTPSCIANAFRQVMVLHHALFIQLFKNDDPIRIHQLP